MSLRAASQELTILESFRIAGSSNSSGSSGIAPTVRVPDSIQSDGAEFGSDLENDLGFIHA
jgi:hypothetical protein